MDISSTWTERQSRRCPRASSSLVGLEARGLYALALRLNLSARSTVLPPMLPALWPVGPSLRSAPSFMKNSLKNAATHAIVKLFPVPPCP